MKFKPNKIAPKVSTKSKQATMSSSAECHLLPCDIEYEGNAPVHIFFRPTKVEGAGPSTDDAATKQPESNDEKADGTTASANSNSNSNSNSSSQEPAILAAQLRGRGLLCVQPTALPDSVVGTVVSSENASRSTGTSAQASGSGGVELVGGTFTSIHEWHHEHDIRSLKRAELKGTGVTGRAVEWMEVARSVHDPIE